MDFDMVPKKLYAEKINPYTNSKSHTLENHGRDEIHRNRDDISQGK